MQLNEFHEEGEKAPTRDDYEVRVLPYCTRTVNWHNIPWGRRAKTSCNDGIGLRLGEGSE